VTPRSAASPADRAARIQRAARLLLTRPMLVAGRADDDDFRLVRTHAAELREWFDRETGWRLIVDAQTARLFKTVSDVDDPTHPARDPRSKAPFGRRRYVLVCLALATLERADNQITLGRLAEQVLLATGDAELAAAGVTFSLESRQERADLVAVVRLLLDWSALRRVVGDEDAYLGSVGDVLYDVDRRVIAGLLTGVRGPSTIDADAFDDRLGALLAEALPDTEEARNRALRHRLTRRLLEDPVLYYDELRPDELNYLTRQRSAITGRITELTGLVAEVRAEGIAMVDPDDELTDVKMPAQGMQSHLTLLLAEHIARQPAGVRLCDLHALTRELAIEHKSYWRKNAADPGAELDLVAAALSALVGLKLVTVGAGPEPLVTPRPAIARYALAEPTIRTAAPRREDAAR
jgi:uncharacterized protein (TIGR02678 family)